MLILLACTYLACIAPIFVTAGEIKINTGNFGLPGIIDLPTAKSTRWGINFKSTKPRIYFNEWNFIQAFPRLGVSFRYAGIGRGGNFAQQREIWDRSFDAQPVDS